jgi:uncharacterized membrane protein
MSAPATTRIVIGPNASLNMRQAWAVMALLAATAAIIAGGLACLGYWPVLPFAGLEVTAFAAALIVSVRRNRYREVLNFEGGRLRIEFGLVGRGVQSTVELRRDWLRVTLDPGPYRNSATRLLLRCHGQSVEVARCLTDEEREKLAVRLQALTGSAWRTVVPQGVADVAPHLRDSDY